MTDRASIYVVLEALDPSMGRFHWSIALRVLPSDLSDQAPDWSCVDLFQVIDVVDPSPGSGKDSVDASQTAVGPVFNGNNLSLPNSVAVKRTWHLAHQTAVDLLSSQRSLTCLGAVRLPDADLPHHDLKEFIEEQEAEQGDSKTTRDVPWSCAQWIMRVLDRLIESGLYELDMNHFYPRIQRLGVELHSLHLADPRSIHVLHFARDGY
ncbi:uncharacterized protein B0H18DRAFT_1001809 [Fomitopsis serialis]|uniref:uncharacterized protein n=1 Tax=Fomitopsis serialis TaxID=139415 RepID=UPI0020086905|nr:uncharacterized protein B0H18DRAFT_1001809 [Neoantrodia serialis]KAH9928201.1 hypothetical protein B0H18DRAFT_1001809 [Neoantrodia serialis]